MRIVCLLNFIVVAVFGIGLSAAFCDISWTRRKRLIMAGGMAGILILQGVVYFEGGAFIAGRWYPLITHFPLAVMLCILNHRCLWPVISVLTAYLCCQLRRWIALLAVAVFPGGAMLQNIVELAVTLPLLLVLMRFIAPSVRSVSHYEVLVQFQFGLVPALYYGFDYVTRIYTALLQDGNMAALEFMPFVCSAAYLVFVFHTSTEEGKRSRLEDTQRCLNLQVAQAVREIEALRESQKKTRIYRHDLRHHMLYLSSCIENGKYGQAQEYIREICSGIEGNQIMNFCQNEETNLVLSAFVGRARDLDVPIKVRAGISQNIHVSGSDLCVLLSNALENALHACQKQKEKGLSSMIKVFMCEKNGKIFLQIINSCDADVVFSQGIPVTAEAGHGLGVRSICAIVRQYGGIYDFLVKDSQFILSVSL